MRGTREAEETCEALSLFTSFAKFSFRKEQKTRLRGRAEMIRVGECVPFNM